MNSLELRGQWPGFFLENRLGREAAEVLVAKLASTGLQVASLPPGLENHPANALLVNRNHDLVFSPTAAPGLKPLIITDREERDVLSVNPYDDASLGALLQQLTAMLQKTSLWGALLIGGKSSRMGRPKHLIEDGTGITWIERSYQLLAAQLSGVVLVGRGEVPSSLAEVIRIPDVPNLAGPLAGMLAAMRWQPDTSWVMVACDMPLVEAEAIRWLANQRKLGRWGSIPRLPGSSRAEPLLARYDRQALVLMEMMVAGGGTRPGALAAELRLDTPEIPAALAASWQNINTPDQLAAL